MKFRPKSFPELSLIFIFLLFSLFSCQKEKTAIINKEQFIKIYARLLIIDQMKIEKEIHDRLVQDLYHENNITTANIDSTVSYYNLNPKEWVEIYDRIRETILELRNIYKVEPSKKIDSPAGRPRKSLLDKTYQKTIHNDNADKKLINQQKESGINENVENDK
jgi:hypothetical protein